MYHSFLTLIDKILDSKEPKQVHHQSKTPFFCTLVLSTFCSHRLTFFVGGCTVLWSVLHFTLQERPHREHALAAWTVINELPHSREINRNCKTPQSGQGLSNVNIDLDLSENASCPAMRENLWLWWWTYGLSDLWTRSLLSSDDRSSVLEALFTRRSRFVTAMLKRSRQSSRLAKIWKCSTWTSSVQIDLNLKICVTHL